MSQHPSLRSSDKDKQHRSVLKRYERLRILKEKEKWKEDDTIFGLPKVKVTRFKIKKEKAAATAEGAEAVAGAPGVGAAGAGQTPAAGKEQTPATGKAQTPQAGKAAPAKGEAKSRQTSK